MDRVFVLGRGKPSQSGVFSLSRRSRFPRKPDRSSMRSYFEAIRGPKRTLWIDTDTRQIHSGKAIHRLPVNSFKVLEILLQESPKLVARERLKQVWVEGYDSDQNLNKAIQELRKALDEKDKLRVDHVLETYRNEGY